MGVSQETKNRIITWSRNSTTGYISENKQHKKMKTLIQKDTCAPMCLCYIYSIHTHTMEYYSAKKIWKFAICNHMDGLCECKLNVSEK